MDRLALDRPLKLPRRLALLALSAGLLVTPAASAATAARAATAGTAASAGTMPSATTRAPTGATRWRAPLTGPLTILRLFDPPTARWEAGHRGVDLAASTGASVTAAGDGVVTYAGMLAGRGVVSVSHGELRTTYEPVTAQVHTGEVVRVGEVLGQLAGSSGAGGHCGATPCLHWGLLRGTDYLNPMSLLRPAPSRLLPLGDSRSR